MLTEKKFKVIVLNPHQTNKFREALRVKAKTDDIDAYVNEYAASYIPEEKIQILREITKLRFEFIKDRKSYMRQIRGLLGLIFPEHELTAIKNPFTIASTAILKKYPTAKHLAEAKPKHIEKIARSTVGNNFNIKEIQHLIDTAKDSIYSGRAKDARGMNLSTLLNLFQQLDKSISDLDQKINDILSPSSPDDEFSFPGANLLTIPGVGQKTVAAILSAVGSNGQSFASVKQLIGHVGFFPQIYQSGETRKDNKISKHGPKYLRWALYISAVACLKHNPQFKNLYHRKLSQGKTGKQALIYVAKKLAQLCLSVLKSGDVYRPERVFVPA